MEKLDTYIDKNRSKIKKVKIEYEWYGEMFSNTRALFYDVPTKDEEKKVFAYIPTSRLIKAKFILAAYPGVVL